MRKSSNRFTASAVSAAVGRNWITEPVRRSKLGQKRFWYSVPAVIASSATMAGTSIGASGALSPGPPIFQDDQKDADKAERKPRPLPACCRSPRKAPAPAA